MGWRSVLLAGLCWALISCATPPAGVGQVSFQPLPRSALVAGDEVQFHVARHSEGEVTTTVLAWGGEGAAPQAVARLVQVRRGTSLHVSVEHLPHGRRTSLARRTELATLEQLYALVFRLEPEARFCWTVVARLSDPLAGPTACDPSFTGMTQAQVLRRVARARAELAGGSPAHVPWRVVELSPGPATPWDADVVAVRVTLNEQPLPDLAIHFNRAPHSICVARTRPDGVAVCRLQDQHGDGHQHDHGVAVVATFPGDLLPQRVLLPTTTVLPGLPARVFSGLTAPHLTSNVSPDFAPRLAPRFAPTPAPEP